MPNCAITAQPTTAANYVTASKSSLLSSFGARAASNSVAVNTITQDLGRVRLKSPAPESQTTQLAHMPGPVQPRVTETNGRKVVYLSDPHSGVSTAFQAGPADAITDPALRQRGVSAARYLYPSDGNERETLFPDFRKRDQPRKFFTVGKVFLVLWVEPVGESVVTSFVPGESLGRFGERVFSKVRRFVVIRAADNYCTCLPIVTYGNKGVAKQGVKKSEHSIVYSTRSPPEPLSEELPVRGEEGMRPQAIRVDADDRADKLDSRSRLDYGKVYTIQHGIKVKSFGKVNPKSMNALVHQFGNVWSSTPLIGQTSARDSSRAVSSRRRVDSPTLQPSSEFNDSPIDGNETSMQNHAKAAIRRLVEAGFSETQAIAALRTELQRRSNVRNDGSVTDEDEDESSEDDG